MRWAIAGLVILALLPQSAGLPVCAPAIHDQAKYRAVGPDGASYASWHPQIDAAAGCAFGHEHGSTPALFDPAYRPLFGYSASKHGMTEGHAGFKGYAFRAGGYSWYVVQHQGTSRADVAACVRHHTLDVAVKDDSGVKADLHLMADFGRAASNEDGAPLQTACAHQAGIPTGSGIRQFPIASSRNNGYEPWRASSSNVIGLSLANVTFNTLDAQTACTDLACATAVLRTGAKGAWRELSASPGFGITQTGAYSNTFMTNAMGTGPGNVQQYIVPRVGIRLTHAIALLPYDGQSYIYADVSPALDASPFLRNPFITGSN